MHFKSCPFYEASNSGLIGICPIHCVNKYPTSCEERGKNQQDATIRCLLSTSVSACFGHHYAHLQENKDLVLLHAVYCAGSAGCGW